MILIASNLPYRLYPSAGSVSTPYELTFNAVSVSTPFGLSRNVAYSFLQLYELVSGTSGASHIHSHTPSPTAAFLSMPWLILSCVTFLPFSRLSDTCMFVVAFNEICVVPKPFGPFESDKSCKSSLKRLKSGQCSFIK
jgi:hypothetical protein